MTADKNVEVAQHRATDHPDLHELYERYGCCMAYIAVEKNGEEAIGSAFHVGEGVFVTARHVVDGTRIKEIRLTNPNLYYRSDLYPKREDGSFVVGPDTPQICTRSDGLLELAEGPWFHATESIDIAILRVDGMEPRAHFVPLGSHLDDWIGGPPELGYFAATSIGVVWECLVLSKMLPQAQKDGWDGLWDDVTPTS
jgi:hypothetical protein